MTRISFELSKKGISDAIKELKAYKSDLQAKSERFVSELAEKGISVARVHVGGYGQYITFGKEIEPQKYGARCIMYGTSGTITRRWMLKDNSVREADISPLLMAEFGSGQLSSSAAGSGNSDIAKNLGMVRGSFWNDGTYRPDKPARKHAFDPNGWNWLGLDGEWHNSIGEQPTMPMFNALVEMETQIIKTAKEVFAS